MCALMGIKRLTQKPTFAAGHHRSLGFQALDRSGPVKSGGDAQQRRRERPIEGATRTGEILQTTGESTQKKLATTAISHLEAAVKLLHKPGLKSRSDLARVQSRARQGGRLLMNLGPQVIEALGLGSKIQALIPQLDVQGGKFSLTDLVAQLKRLVGAAQPETSSVLALDGVTAGSQEAALHAHLKAAVTAFQRRDFAEVERLLTDNDAADACGVRLNTQNILMRNDPSTLSRGTINSMILQIRSASMSWEDGKVDIVVPMAMSSGDDFRQLEMPDHIRELYTPILMEEWMHQLQRRTGQPCSKLTTEYMEDKGIESFGGLHELDILAAFYEWGMEPKRLGTVGYYQERLDFDEWYQAKYNGDSS